MSCVMTIQPSTTKTQCILKLYDRRFAVGLREDQKVPPWRPRIEHEYRQLVDSGKESVLFDRWKADGEDDEDEDEDEDEGELDLALDEAGLQFECYKAYETEVHAYDLMHDIQGSKVPTLLDKVNLNLDDSDTANPRYKCPGILLQYIHGFLLTDIADKMEKALWQSACDQAIEIVQQTSARGILNHDVKTRSFIVSKQADGSPLVFMIDFGFCEFRDQFKDDYAWRRAQAYDDEEGAVGRVMWSNLGDGFCYRESDRALRLSFEFMREEPPPTDETFEMFAERCREEWRRQARERR